jgi:hypothetical protein|tara:strand:- start:382 stop:498 length:117 start_codon:yes stop_codon:yes gene_type:complete
VVIIYEETRPEEKKFGRHKKREISAKAKRKFKKKKKNN